jgi:hypothetical protein
MAAALDDTSADNRHARVLRNAAHPPGGPDAAIGTRICIEDGTIMTTPSPTQQPDGPGTANSASEPSILCEALFASHLQSSQRPSADDVRAAIDITLRALGVGQCTAWVAQEFGDHPETAITRMRWATDAVAAAHDGAPENQSLHLRRLAAGSDDGSAATGSHTVTTTTAPAVA